MFLGVLIDMDISRLGHTCKLLTRIGRTMGTMECAREFMNGPQLLLLYNTMVLPHLQYHLINWGNFKGVRDGLMSLQKSLVRIIAASDNPISHMDPLFAKLAIRLRIYVNK